MQVGSITVIRNAILLLGAILLNQCTGYLPLSDLINNSVTLKVLGTYESNDPYAQRSTIYLDDTISTTGVTGASPALGATNLTDFAANASTGLITQGALTKYYFDIAEIRLAKGQGKSSSQTITDYWQQFAISRQLMCSEYTTTSTQLLTNCADQNGIQRLAEFFSGGFSYPAVDVPRNNYNHLGIYFRRFVASGAALFTGTGAYSGGTSTSAVSGVTAAFDNRTLYAFDVESSLQNAYGETNTQGRMFPLERKDLNLDIEGNQEPYVLEVRFFIKNLMMVHMRQITGDSANASSTSNSAIVYTGLADWNVNHVLTDTLVGSVVSGNALKQGGALLMTARVYQPSKVGSIRMSSTVGSGYDYFAVQPAGTTYTTPVVTMPLAATNGLNTTISNLQPGTYDVYRMCDAKYCSSSSTKGTCDTPAVGTNKDGFPETAKQCGTSVTVSTGTTTTVLTTNCASCP